MKRGTFVNYLNALALIFLLFSGALAQGGGGGTEAAGEQAREEDRRAEGIEPIVIHVVPVWSKVEPAGNRTRLWQYRSLTDGFFPDIVFVALRDRNSLRSLGRGYWRGADTRDQTGFVEFIPSTASHSLRFWGDAFTYFPDASLDPVESSDASSWRLWAHYAGVGIDPSVDFKVTDRRFRERDIVRLRPGIGLDYRVLDYDLLVSVPVPRGDVLLGLKSVALDDKTGTVPKGVSSDLHATVHQSLGPNFAASAGYNDVKIYQDGLKTAHANTWRLDLHWFLAPKLLWRGVGQTDTVTQPDTVTRYAHRRDRTATDLIWRPFPTLKLQSGYTRRAISRVEQGSNVIQRPVWNEFFVSTRWRHSALGQFRLRYRDSQLDNPPASGGLISPEEPTLYFDRTQSFTGTWSRSLGYLTTVYGFYQWTKRKNSQRDLHLTLTSFNGGISTQFSPMVTAFIDFLWEDWGSNYPADDSLNTGDSGVIRDPTLRRPLFSRAQVTTIGANLQLTETSTLDCAFTHYISRGGEHNLATYFSVGYAQQVLPDFSVGVQFQRLVNSDRIISDYGYDVNVFTFTLTGRFVSW